jgi:two-component system NtrC family sensor kinase
VWTAVQTRSLKLTTKFMLGIGVILFIAVSIISFVFYVYLKDLYVREIYEKTDIALGHIDATMEYVRDELRPKMLHVLPKDEFVREAMSTSVVNKGIMERFVRKFPHYVYRRVALNPMNPNNTADEFEKAYILKFSATPERKNEWRGVISRGDKRYYIHLKSVRMQKQCLMCHGAPSSSPKSLLARYGSRNGHNWKVGEVVGLESIAIPVDATFYQIRQVAFSIFLLGLTGMVVLFMVLNYFYYVVAAKPLKKASLFFKSVVSGEKGLDASFDVRGQDEISELADSLNRMVSHLKNSQAALKSSESKYRHIFEASKDGIIVTDCQGMVVDVNNSGVDLFGCNNREDFMESMSLHDFFVSGEACAEFLRRMERDGFVKDYGTAFRKKDGGEIEVLITATQRKDEKKNICGYDCIVKDITAWKRMERQIRQAEKLASIGQLAAGVAHEINNPLSVVMGYSKMLQRDSVDKRMKDDLEVISNNATLCKKIVEDLLNFSRQTKTRYGRADVGETIESVASVLEGEFAGRDVSIERNYDPSVPAVAMDVDKMKQVCMNLLMNAYQAMDGGGRITVSTRHDRAHGGVVITFVDNGRGIPREIQNRVFEPFFTTKEPGQGTGLGTAVVYGIINEHNGRISFRSEEGKGTTFRIWLPLENAES